MARYNIRGVHLAQKLDISANAMSALKNAKTMPRIDGMALNLLCNALNELAEDLDKLIAPADLLDYSQDPINPSDLNRAFSINKRHKGKKPETSDNETMDSKALKSVASKRGIV